MELKSIGSLHFHSAAAIVAASALLVSIHPCIAAADGEGFPSPEQAAKALVGAAESGNITNVLKILGPSAKDLLTTSDPVADQRVRETFVKKAKQKMIVATDPKRPTQKILEIGADRWPFPIPLVETAGSWHFDVAKGKQQILFRRIGDNELTALDVSRGYVEAQNEYYEEDRMGNGTRQYAQKFISSPGQHDGLYWPSTSPDDESPIGELVAKAVAEGYTDRTQPYHGYHFKVLKGQGSHASGGAMNYMDGDAMTRGFALIAWPSTYGSTGVMTFLVDRSGIVYEKNLGEKTVDIAGATSVYDPDQTWTPVAGPGVSMNVSRTSRNAPAGR